ncbi:MAG TPA: DUF2752 domain-containing protein [Vicinamibacteria bacterium]|nr:DUF2752 domain-containing protein [Vicinamibacteria bacterium]
MKGAGGAPWRGVAAVVLATCGGALWLGGGGSLRAAQRLEAWSSGRADAPAFTCSFRKQTGLPCLGCGGTRAFSEAARGRWTAALAANVLGAFAGGAAWLMALAAMATLAGAGASWLRLAGVLVLASLPAALALGAVMWWTSLPPGALS